MDTPKTEGVNWFREALPIDIKVVNGSVILGSDATTMVLIGDFKRAGGVLSISDVSAMYSLWLIKAVQVVMRPVQAVYGVQLRATQSADAHQC